VTRWVVTGDEAHACPATDGGHRTLYRQAVDDFQNISYPAIAMLCVFQEGLAAEFVERAKEAERLFLGLAQLVFAERCGPLKRAFLDIMGKDWANWYQRRR
jgi:hypothetical protein